MTTNPTPNELRAMSEAATQGEWFVDTENSEGEYGVGPDTQSCFLVSVIYGPDGKSLFDPHNSDMIEVHEDYPDEDGYCSAWDETSRRNAAFIVSLVNLYRTGQLVHADEARAAERADVVAWLRHDLDDWPDYVAPSDIADAIEAGEHTKEPSDG